MTAVSSVYAQRLVLTFFLISFGIYLFLATVTYTPFDPGWMHISSDTQQVSNASGVAGAWIADLLFGFLGWASLLIPIYFFIEAIQVWWPRSFLNRPFRYAAQFFILLTTASLNYLLWQLPADTLSNASGGIIGYELGESLSQLVTIYGAVIFLIALTALLVTLAFGIQWNKTWATLKATPAYLQELFYKNVPESESDYDLTTPQAAKTKTIAKESSEKSSKAAPAATAAGTTTVMAESSAAAEAAQDPHEQTAQRLYQDMLEQHQHEPVQFDEDDDAEFERTLAKAHALEQDSQRIIPTGEVWKALQSDENHKREIDELLRAAEEDHAVPANLKQILKQELGQSGLHVDAEKKSTAVDWNDDEIFDELLDVVPNAGRDAQARPAVNDAGGYSSADLVDQGQSGTLMGIGAGAATLASGLNQAGQAAVASQLVKARLGAEVLGHAEQLASELDGLASMVDQERSSVDHPHTHSKAEQSPHFKELDVDELAAQNTAPEQHHSALAAVQNAALVSEEERQRILRDKEAFRDVWQETVGVIEPESADDFDFDAPLTDAMGRPMSRSMQVAEKRKNLPPLPGLDMLDKVDPNKKVNFTAEQLARLSELLEIKLQEFNVKAKVIEAQPGPVVTRFELDLAPGVKASKVTNISRDLARSMSMASVRVVEVIPGKPYIGIEVPNSTREMVRLIELLETPAYRDPNSLISMAMGKDISGNPVLTDLAKAPHMLVAGTTGSGKSVAVNSMILSMLLKYTPDQLRLILIDPKQLELANYNDIPHLLTPVVTDMKDAVSALNWCVNEMERRYKLMSFLKIRKLSDYNRKVEEAIANGEDLIDPTWKPSDSATQERAPRLRPLPSIVIVADEFADMIMQVGKKAEEMITRLAQKSRAAGIHLLLATQRPSVDVITGLIKANIPTRVALRVNSKIDSRTILDAGGAEDLLGHGDMLFLGPGKIEPERVHGAFISDDEVNRICDAWRERGSPDYVDEILTPFDEETTSRGFEDGGDGGSDRDALYDQCVAFVLETRKASTSSLQRKFSLGYNRAARIIDQMEENGIVSAMGANGKRDVLV